MNLQPIHPPEPLFKFTCLSCGKPFPSTMPGARADLDGEPFAAYYCAFCAQVCASCGKRHPNGFVHRSGTVAGTLQCRYCEATQTAARIKQVARAIEEARRHSTLEDADFVLASPIPYPGDCRAWACWRFKLAGLRHLINGFAVAAALALLASPAVAAERAKPISSITVRVVSEEHFAKKAKKPGMLFVITTADTDSCVAWVSTKAPGVVLAETEAFKACRTAIDKAVDSAHHEAEKAAAATE